MYSAPNKPTQFVEVRTHKYVYALGDVLQIPIYRERRFIRNRIDTL